MQTAQMTEMISPVTSHKPPLIAYCSYAAAFSMFIHDCIFIHDSFIIMVQSGPSWGKQCTMRAFLMVEIRTGYHRQTSIHLDYTLTCE